MTVSTHVQAVLLLTAHFSKTRSDAEKPLSPSEWGRFAGWLKSHDLIPENLLDRETARVLVELNDRTITVARIDALLARAGSLGLALERWERAGLWVLTRADSSYPQRLKRLLKSNSPPVLFGCGNANLLNGGGLAVVGSRNATHEELTYAADLGRLAAEQGHSIVSGGARGIDEAAMMGALERDGTVIGVLADNLLRATTSARYRSSLLRNSTVLVSPFNPEGGFDVGNAMARNRYIYSLSDAAVVVSSASGSGGTWAGAVENLRNGWVPLWVKGDSDVSAGNAALIVKGARVAPLMPFEISGLTTASEESRSVAAELIDSTTPEIPANAPELRSELPTPELGRGTLYESFLTQFRVLASHGAITPVVLQTELQLEKSQLNAWLKRAVNEGVAKKLSKPVRYEFNVTNSAQQSMLF